MTTTTPLPPIRESQITRILSPVFLRQSSRLVRVRVHAVLSLRGRSRVLRGCLFVNECLRAMLASCKPVHWQLPIVHPLLTPSATLVVVVVSLCCLCRCWLAAFRRRQVTLITAWCVRACVRACSFIPVISQQCQQACKHADDDDRHRIGWICCVFFCWCSFVAAFPGMQATLAHGCLPPPDSEDQGGSVVPAESRRTAFSIAGEKARWWVVRLVGCV